MPCIIPKVTTKNSMDVAKIVKKLPRKNTMPPNIPTDLIENFSNKLFENRPAQLTAPFIMPITIVTVLVPPPKFAIKSLNSKPNEERHPTYDALNDLFESVQRKKTGIDQQKNNYSK